jgi:hypothetical protein
MKRLVFPVALGLIILVVALVTLGLATLPETARAQSTQREVTVLDSEERTATTTSADIVNLGENLNVKGAYVFLDVTGVETTPLVTLSIQAIDPVSGDYATVFAATTGVSSTVTYLVYPGVGSATDGISQTRSYPLPAGWRVSVAHQDADPITYSVGALLIP